MTSIDGGGPGPSSTGLNIYRAGLLAFVALATWLANQTWNGVQAESDDIRKLSLSINTVQTNLTRDETELVIDDRRIHNLETDVATIRALQPVKR